MVSSLIGIIVRITHPMPYQQHILRLGSPGTHGISQEILNRQRMLLDPETELIDQFIDIIRLRIEAAPRRRTPVILIIRYRVTPGVELYTEWDY
jgi:hypothetical protein